eukprot:2629653-Amphidinium_carterae.1
MSARFDNGTLTRFSLRACQSSGVHSAFPTQPLLSCSEDPLAYVYTLVRKAEHWKTQQKISSYA